MLSKVLQNHRKLRLQTDSAAWLPHCTRAPKTPRSCFSPTCHPASVCVIYLLYKKKEGFLINSHFLLLVCLWKGKSTTCKPAAPSCIPSNAFCASVTLSAIPGTKIPERGDWIYISREKLKILAHILQKWQIIDFPRCYQIEALRV